MIAIYQLFTVSIGAKGIFGICTLHRHLHFIFTHFICKCTKEFELFSVLSVQLDYAHLALSVTTVPRTLL